MSMLKSGLSALSWHFLSHLRGVKEEKKIGFAKNQKELWKWPKKGLSCKLGKWKVNKKKKTNKQNNPCWGLQVYLAWTAYEIYQGGRKQSEKLDKRYYTGVSCWQLKQNGFENLGWNWLQAPSLRKL